jgi:glyoxylase-like metal-dependent hydrolase (beta-lactamase superfamily II)
MDWTVAALAVGQHPARNSRLLYGYRSYGRPDASIDLTFFMWAVRRGNDIIVVDTGFDEAWFAAQGADVRWAISPVDALRAIGIDPAEVGTVVLTHLHFDHIGMVASFPTAQYVIQRREWEFWHSELGSSPPMCAHTDLAALTHLRDAQRSGRVRLVDGRVVLAQGVEVVPAPGHTPGQQVVIVNDALVLAADAAHFYEELDNARVLPVPAHPRRGWHDGRAWPRPGCVGSVCAAGSDAAGTGGLAPTARQPPLTDSDQYVGSEVSSIVPAIGPPPLETTATCASATWRASACPRNCSTASCTRPYPWSRPAESCPPEVFSGN